MSTSMTAFSKKEEWEPNGRQGGGAALRVSVFCVPWGDAYSCAVDAAAVSVAAPAQVAAPRVKSAREPPLVVWGPQGKAQKNRHCVYY